MFKVDPRVFLKRKLLYFKREILGGLFSYRSTRRPKRARHLI